MKAAEKNPEENDPRVFEQYMREKHRLKALVKQAREVRRLQGVIMQGYMTDAQGRQVPDEMVSAVDKLRDQTVRSVMARTFAARDALTAFKALVREEIQTFLNLSAEQHGTTFGGKQGNISLTS